MMMANNGIDVTHLREDEARISEALARELFDICQERGLSADDSAIYARFLLGGQFNPWTKR